MFSFDGTMQSDGGLSGNYCHVDQEARCTSDDGIWSVAPTSVDRGWDDLQKRQASFFRNRTGSAPRGGASAWASMSRCRKSLKIE